MCIKPIPISIGYNKEHIKAKFSKPKGAKPKTYEPGGEFTANGVARGVIMENSRLLTDEEEAEVRLSVRRECRREGVNEYDTQKQVTKAIRQAQRDLTASIIRAECGWCDTPLIKEGECQARVEKIIDECFDYFSTIVRSDEVITNLLDQLEIKRESLKRQ